MDFQLLCIYYCPCKVYPWQLQTIHIQSRMKFWSFFRKIGVITKVGGWGTVETHFLKMSRFSRLLRQTLWRCRDWDSRSRHDPDKSRPPTLLITTVDKYQWHLQTLRIQSRKKFWMFHRCQRTSSAPANRSFQSPSQVQSEIDYDYSENRLLWLHSILSSGQYN